MRHIVLTFVSAAAILVLDLPSQATAGVYLNSAHGNSTYGVKRASTSAQGYVRGNCAHCHEQHPSADGSTSASAGGDPSGNLLFADNYVTQTDGFCFKCHTNSGSVQSGIVNRSYSYRAGNWSADLLNNVYDAFNTTGYSSHNLGDIRTFISNQPTWKYSSGANPCDACHNPHAVQGDPANAGNSPKSSTGGLMLSLPSQHGSPVWGLFTAKMSGYTGQYQPTHRFGGLINGYEPDGSMITNGSNLTDFNTFCLDCHNNSNTINSAALGLVKKIDWLGADRHGIPTGNSPSAKLNAPYTDKTSYVLACTDCHEPHGSSNIYLTRKEVNNGLVTVTGAQQSGAGSQWASLCERCHGNATVVGSAHHTIMGATPCTDCHDKATPPVFYVACTNCHYHGSTAVLNGITYRTF